MRYCQTKVALTLIVTSLLVALTGCAVGKSGPESMQIKAQKDTLLVRDIGGGQPFYVRGWCGNEGLLIHSDMSGSVWLGLNGKRVTISTKKSDFLDGCTPDGKWVFYRDRDSSRIYRDRQGRLPKDTVDDGPGWHGFVIDLYRFEVATGIRQKFAVARDDSSAHVSPDGSKVLLGNMHDYTIEMPEPRWKKVWFANEWIYNETLWFADSSGIVTMIWGLGSSPGVEFFGENGWAKEYDPGRLGLGHEPERSFSLGTVDKDNMVYFTAIESGKTYSRSKFHFFSCKIKKQKMFCEVTGQFDEGGKNIDTYAILPGGDFVFSRDDDACIRRFKPGQTHARCIADTRYGNETYEEVRMVAVSPDGSQMAFRRSKLPPKSEGRFYYYQYDLFVKELSVK